MWDMYIQDSLKDTTRQREVQASEDEWLPQLHSPRNGKTFFILMRLKLSCSNLAQELVQLPIGEGKVIYATNGVDVLCTMKDADVRNLAPYSHEEADTHLFLHAADAVRNYCL